MSICYLCGEPLTTENSSLEHIIPNCIGGNLTSKDLPCVKCNSTYGSNTDAEIARRFNWAANMLNVKRDRGRPLPEKGIDSKTGIEYDYFFGKPTMVRPVIEVDENAKTIHVETRDIKQARKVLNGLKRKYPKIDIEEVLATAYQGKAFESEYFFNVETRKTLNLPYTMNIDRVQLLESLSTDNDLHLYNTKNMMRKLENFTQYTMKKQHEYVQECLW